MRRVIIPQLFLGKHRLRVGHIGTTGTSTAVPCAMTTCNGCERPLAAADLGGASRADQRRGGDNGTPPREPGPDSAEARTGEVQPRLGYAFMK